MLYSDYSWKNGIPVGIKGPQDHYEIITDPYGKRYLIIDYPYTQLIYDSAVIDFRHLNMRHQLGWTKEALNDHTFLIRDRDNFPQIIERQTFDGTYPILCEFFSLQEKKIAFQRIYYQFRNDPFNGVILYDLLEKPILKKTYEVNSASDFTELTSTISSF